MTGPPSGFFGRRSPLGFGLFPSESFTHHAQPLTGSSVWPQGAIGTAEPAICLRGYYAAHLSSLVAPSPEEERAGPRFTGAANFRRGRAALGVGKGVAFSARERYILSVLGLCGTRSLTRSRGRSPARSERG